MSASFTEGAPSSVKRAFDLTGRVAVITGGAGLLGRQHAEAVAEMGGIPVLLDLDGAKAEQRAANVAEAFSVEARAFHADVTKADSVTRALDAILDSFGRVDILINNAANDPKVGLEGGDREHWSRLENFPLDAWRNDLEVGLTGAFLCSQIIGGDMARRRKGVILNIASDLGVIAPDQRIYRRSGLPEQQQRVKPASYCAAKAGLIGLTRYLATYWADKGVRVNCISPGGVHNHQDPAFVERVSQLIPLGRMARADEYKAAVVFLVSDASSYVTGTNLVADGGRSAW